MTDFIEMSFSQANTYKQCKKQWAFSKVDRLVGIPNIDALRGNRYHEAVEAKMVDGSFEHISKPVQFALDTALSLGGVLESEKYVEKISGEVKVRGYIDCYAEDVGTNSVDGKEVRTVADWKFPTKDPGRVPKTSYVRQIQLYAFLAGADQCAIVYPEYETVFNFEANQVKGQKVYDDLVEVGKKIVENKDLEKSGFDVEGSPSILCGWCEFRDICKDRR